MIIKTVARRFCTLVLLVCAWTYSPGSPAQAVQVIRESQKIAGDWKTRPILESHDGRSILLNCYILSTQKGQQWSVTMKQDTGTLGAEFILGVGIGQNCLAGGKEVATDHPAALFSHKAKVRFISGGGDYLILLAMAGDYSPYVLDLKLSPGLANSGFATPGQKISKWVWPDPEPVTVSSTASNEADSYRPGTVLRDCEATCPEMVALAAGSFLMGSASDAPGRVANEGPRHEIHIPHPFAVSRYEITFAEYDVCVADHACQKIAYQWGGDRQPATNVSWYDAQAYASWISEKTGHYYSLLSEAEWEYGARAGTSTPWNTGSAILTDDGNILDAVKQTVPVGSYPANAFGLYDMHGNAAEWVLDCYDPGYFGTPVDGAAVNHPDCKEHVVRGGSFADEPTTVRSAARDHATPIYLWWSYGTDNSRTRGFRLGRRL